MSNVSKIIRQAYYDALQGNISVDVYKEDVPDSVIGHYVILRVESETDASHKNGHVTHPVVITEVVGVFGGTLDPDEVDDIDAEIRSIISPTVGAFILVANGFQIKNIKAETSSLIAEDDGTKRYYRKITRWTQRISHT